MENNVSDELLQVTSEIAKEYNLIFNKNTHFNAKNLELKKYNKNSILRLNIDFDNDESLIAVTLYKDVFPIDFAYFLERLHDRVPLFPYLAKIDFQRIKNLPLEINKNDFMQEIEKIIKKSFA